MTRATQTDYGSYRIETDDHGLIGHVYRKAGQWSIVPDSGYEIPLTQCNTLNAAIRCLLVMHQNTLILAGAGNGMMEVTE